MATKTKKSSQVEFQALQEDVRESAHKIWLAGLGALSLAEEEGTKLFKNLVERGEGFETKSKEQVGKVVDFVKETRDKAEDTLEKITDSYDEQVAEALERLGVPTSAEVRTLTKRVEELTKKVDQLNAKAPVKAPAKKAPAKAKTRTTQAKKTS